MSYSLSRMKNNIVLFPAVIIFITNCEKLDSVNNVKNGFSFALLFIKWAFNFSITTQK